jgi:2-octaprenyl-6-methoxyphenol hydroxylase
MNEAPLSIAVVGAGPVGLALALHAARALPHASVTLFDSRPADKDVSDDPRTLALSLGSVQILERLGAWRAQAAQPILEVHVSQQPPSGLPELPFVPEVLPKFLAERLDEPELRIRAIDEAVPLLGAVLNYGGIVAPLQEVWLETERAEPQRLHSRFGTAVSALKNLERGVEVDAGIAERYDLAVIAEGGVYTERSAAVDAGRALVPMPKAPLTHDYAQTAWVGQVTFADDAAGGDGTARRARGVAFERFTRHGPAALLPLKDGRAAVVWCVASDDDPVRELDDMQRIAVLNSIFPRTAGQIVAISPLKAFPLGLIAERTLTDGRIVRIGNAAQTLHPVAGQGLNLGLRDAFELVRALRHEPDVAAVLRRLEWQRAPDRWAMIAATDFLARSFTWKLPGAGAARGLGIAALQALGPLKSMLARQMMFGSRR